MLVTLSGGSTVAAAAADSREDPARAVRWSLLTSDISRT